MSARQWPAMPWHEGPWGRLRQRIETGRVPHAILVCGPAGLGKLAFAQRFAERLLCDEPTAAGEACGSCHGCRLQGTGAHPDRLLVEVESGRTRVRVEQIRRLIAFTELSSQYGRYRIALLPAAERMNAQSANALLKTLEEPPASAVITLVTERPAGLPATIRSRCYQARIQPPEREAGARWLRTHHPEAEALLGLAGGAPLRAARLAEAGTGQHYRTLIAQLRSLAAGESEPTAIAAEWREMHRTDFLELLQIAVADIARALAAGRAHTQEAQGLSDLPRAVDCAAVQAFYCRLAHHRASAEQPLHGQLLMESVLAEWVQHVRDQQWGYHEPE